MSGNGTFQWISHIPSISNLSSDDSMFPALDESLSRPPSSKHPSNPNSNTADILTDVNVLQLGNLSLSHGLNTAPEPEDPSKLKLDSMTSSPPPLSVLSSSIKTESAPATPAPSPRRVRQLPSLVRMALAPTPPPSGSTRIPQPALLGNNYTTVQPQFRRGVSPVSNLGYPAPGNADDALISSPFLFSDQFLNPDDLKNRSVDTLAPPGQTRELADNYEWQMCRDICNYFDGHLKEAVDDNTALNLTDMQHAAAAIGYHLPLNTSVIEVLMQVGWQVPNFQSSSTPWKDALKAVEREIHRRSHERYLIDLQHEQEQTAKRLATHLIKRNTLKMWMDALRTDIIASDRVLEMRDRSILKPKYFKLWKLRSQVVSIIAEEALDLNDQYACRHTMQLWRTNLLQIQSLQSGGEIFTKKLLCKFVQTVWLRRLDEVNALKDQAAQLRQQLQKRFVVHACVHECHEIKARKINEQYCKRKFFKIMERQAQQTHQLNQKADSFVKKSVLSCWAQAIQRNGRMKDFVIKEQRKMLLTFFQNWRYKMLLNTTRAEIQCKQDLEVLQMWRLRMRTKQLRDQQHRRVLSNGLRLWRDRLDHIKKAQFRTARIIASSDRTGLKDVWDIWRAKCNREKRLRQVSRRLCDRLTKQRMFKLLKAKQSFTEEQRKKAENITRSSCLRKYFAKLRSSSAASKSARLTDLRKQCENRLRSRAATKILSSWRRDARYQYKLSRKIRSVTLASLKHTVFSNWRRSLSEYKRGAAAAPQIWANLTAKKLIAVWRDRLADLGDLEATVEDINIARLGLVMRGSIRQWQLKCATNSGQEAQAETYFHHQQRRKQLAILKEWRSQLAYSSMADDGGSALADASMTSYFFPAESPSKLAAISPQFISKWKDKTSDKSPPSRLLQRHGYNKPSPRANAQPHTPTKPFRTAMFQ